ncbi:hypothetical protein AVEN_25035-1 [Araneus ventricosus]|uniref:Pre-C2HC domain-containing protein n=1 Tax=Araneus ventricosus TaxID=182803 RepID=A0A4Y2CTP5_ARAVE|nr:hypothetical protein AVEN_25035-1 [Araneus ventricosus]
MSQGFPQLIANHCIHINFNFLHLTNCKYQPRCIKCNQNYSTIPCEIKEKIEKAVFVNCNDPGHPATWRGCKALPKVKPVHRNLKSDADITKKSEEKSDDPSTVPRKQDQIPTPEHPLPVVISVKQMFEVFQEIKFLQEFPSRLASTQKMKQTQDEEENKIVFMNALLE